MNDVLTKEAAEFERWVASVKVRIIASAADLDDLLMTALKEALARGRRLGEAGMADKCVQWAASMMSQSGWALACSGRPGEDQFQRALLPYLERKINEALHQVGKPPAFPGWMAKNPMQRAQLEAITGQPEGPPNPPGCETLMCPHKRRWPCDDCWVNGWDLLPHHVAAQLFQHLTGRQRPTPIPDSVGQKRLP